jgi:predicted transport protein
MTRRRRLGDLGELWTVALLRDAGFTSVRDLNAVKYNHPGGDFLAERAGGRYFITVKARNKFVQRTRRLNGRYNIFPAKVRRAAREYDAIPSWLTIQLDTDQRCYSAYFGTIDSLQNPEAVAVPMSPSATARYECIARDRFDEAITTELSNQFVETDEPVAEKPAVSPKAVRPSTGRPTPERGAGRSAASATRGAVSFEDHVAYADARLRPVLRELRMRVRSLGETRGRAIAENPTRHQRVAYSVNRIFLEVKVQKKRLLLRFFGANVPDPRNVVADIPDTHGWQHDKEIAVGELSSLDYAMPFVEASYDSNLTKMARR